MLAFYTGVNSLSPKFLSAFIEPTLNGIIENLVRVPKVQLALDRQR
jgi:hypothetical protein